MYVHTATVNTLHGGHGYAVEGGVDTHDPDAEAPDRGEHGEVTRWSTPWGRSTAELGCNRWSRWIGWELNSSNTTPYRSSSDRSEEDEIRRMERLLKEKKRTARLRRADREHRRNDSETREQIWRENRYVRPPRGGKHPKHRYRGEGHNYGRDLYRAVGGRTKKVITVSWNPTVMGE